MRLVAVWALSGLLLVAQSAWGDAASCGELVNAYGPFDYTNAEHRQEKLNIVEINHFTPEVRALLRGKSDAYPGADIDYTLRAFPNHHGALQSLLRLAAKEKQSRLPKMNFSVECYFDRAVRMNENDATSKMLYAQFLDQRNRQDEALAMLQAADKVRPEDANIYYNLGLLYLKMKDYTQAKQYADKAYAQGFPLPGLRDKLKAVGRWDG